jgi:hypothetical protein
LSKLISIKSNNAKLLATILLLGVIGTGLLSSPLNSYGEVYQSVKCDDTNININGINQEQTQRQSEDNNFDAAATEAQQSTPEEKVLNSLIDTRNQLLNAERNIVNICINDNDNELTGIFRGEQESGNNNNENGPTTCEQCFEEKLSDTSLNNFLGFLSGVGWGLTEFCNALADQQGEGAIELAVELNLKVVSISDSEIQDVIQCLKDIGFIPPPST